MPLDVLIVGAGPAGLEAALALREQAGERVALTVLAPDAALEYRPLSVADPFALAGTRSYPLDAIFADVGAQHHRGGLARVTAEEHEVVTQAGERLSYDVLLVALGATPEPAFRPGAALTFWGPGDAEAVHGLVQDVEGGYTRSVAFVVPPGQSWPLPLYELALLTAARARDCGMTVELHLVTPEAAPLDVFGVPANVAAAEALADAGIEVAVASYAEVPAQGTLVLAPDDRRLQVDRIVALPRLVGPRIEGLPCDHAGFVPTDAYARVRDTPDVYAAGDVTTFPLKQGHPAGRRRRGGHRRPGGRRGRAGPVPPRPARPAPHPEWPALSATRRDGDGRRRRGRVDARPVVAAEQDRRPPSRSVPGRARCRRGPRAGRAPRRAAPRRRGGRAGPRGRASHALTRPCSRA